MQTFLPFQDFKKSAKVLDYRRLGKQRVEAYQIIRILGGKQKSNAWKNHPAVLMWKNHITALKLYFNIVVLEWERRGYKNNMKLYRITLNNISYPFWLGNNKFHSCHRATLLFKDPKWYSKFKWKEKPKYKYVWPIRISQIKEKI
jgi:hypothetical protein